MHQAERRGERKEKVVAMLAEMGKRSGGCDVIYGARLWFLGCRGAVDGSDLWEARQGACVAHPVAKQRIASAASDRWRRWRLPRGALALGFQGERRPRPCLAGPRGNVGPRRWVGWV